MAFRKGEQATIRVDDREVEIKPDAIRLPARAKPPFRIVTHAESFQIVDSTGMGVAYIYFANSAGGMSRTDRMSRADAKRLAVMIALMPELLAEK